MKLGVFGGTFNPPHKGHTEMALQAKKHLALDKLLVFPCGIPPHKSCGVDGKVRLELTRKAFDGIGEIDDWELRRGGKSYTLDTLEYVSRKYVGAEIYLIIGGDSLRDFGKWHCPEQIAKMCALAVLGRGADSALAEAVSERYGCKVVLLDCVPPDISSSVVRLKRQFGRDIADDVGEEVARKIENLDLYREYSEICARLPDYLTPKRLEHTFYVVKAG
ncbi:MAG: nicotinate (nicotinamide) nucleotide adenylyltransferase, partial [Corallococcus sp.]|nr:nicotinate (nicotinamide) nucleotide adenylyltransferase [Corallococcus sp.]